MQEKKVEISIGRRHTRMLCPYCEVLSELKTYSDETLMAVLMCGCVRTLALLPSAPGAVSLEAILSNDPLARKLFPFLLDDRTGVEPQIAEEREREAWAA